MRLFHLSDLHLGKRVLEMSMLQDQAHILEQILAYAKELRPRCALICGDVYDKPVPPVEAVRLFDDFLWELSSQGIQVLVISGNHDSPERMAFGGRIMRRGGVSLAPVYEGPLSPLTLEDEIGPVDFYLLPFVKPAHVRAVFPQAELSTYTQALAQALEGAPGDPSRRNVLLAHQFVTGAATCQSEEVSVGGMDNVDGAVFGTFDYVALGHLHSPQHVGRETLRYCGTPLAYSFSEAGQEKSVTVVDLGEKGCVELSTLPLAPLRRMRRLRGSYLELTARSAYLDTATQDYLHITLTDEQEIPDAMGRLRSIYPNALQLAYDNQRTRSQAHVTPAEQMRRKSPLELFGELYQAQNGAAMSPEQEDLLKKMIERVWEAEA